MTIKRFEDLEVWQKARELCKQIRTIVDTTSLGKDYALRDQILRSSGSVMDNIAEGFERDGKREFINFLYISKGSLGETRSQIHRSFDTNFISENTYNCLLNDCINLSTKLAHFADYLFRSDFDGTKKKTKNTDNKR